MILVVFVERYKNLCISDKAYSGIERCPITCGLLKVERSLSAFVGFGTLRAP